MWFYVKRAYIGMSLKLAGFTWEEFLSWTCDSLVVKKAHSAGSDRESKREGKMHLFTLQQQAQNRSLRIFCKLNTDEQDLLLQSVVLPSK